MKKQKQLPINRTGAKKINANIDFRGSLIFFCLNCMKQKHQWASKNQCLHEYFITK